MMSFSNYFEGFGVDDECDVPEGDKPLLCGSDPVIRRRLHNLVSWCESHTCTIVLGPTGPYTVKWYNDQSSTCSQ